MYSSPSIATNGPSVVVVVVAIAIVVVVQDR